MQKIILAYNFTPERLQALKLICMMLRTQLRAVARAELLQPVGYLAGLPEMASVSEAYSGDEGQEEMLLMCGFSRQDLDRLLAAVKKGKLRQVALKAMLTGGLVLLLPRERTSRWRQGAILLLLADSLVRLSPGAGELKLGIAMALLGAPFFLWLLWRKRELIP